MVDLIATNEKLRVRTARIVKAATNASDDDVAKALTAANYVCKNAIIMILKNVSYAESETLLAEYDNLVTKIINDK